MVARWMRAVKFAYTQALIYFRDIFSVAFLVEFILSIVLTARLLFEFHQSISPF